MLYNYQQQCQLLLRDVREANYNPADLVTYINEARGQIAADSECIRSIATTSTSVAVISFANFTVSLSGASGVTNLRNLWYGVGSGQSMIYPKSFEWYSVYYMNSATQPSGPPFVWSQFGQGIGGSLYLGPVPDQVYTITADAVCYPIPLVTDATVEAIPAYWQDCVQFLACFYALINGGNNDDADRMFNRYELYRDRARKFANPSVLPGIWSQAPDRTMANKLGMQKEGAR